MKITSGKLFLAAASVLMLVGLLAFSFATPTTTVGQETDVPVVQPDDDSDVGSGAEGPDDVAAPPASLPNAGNGGFGEGVGTAKLMLVVLLAGLGLSLAGAGSIAARRRSQENSS